MDDKRAFDFSRRVANRDYYRLGHRPAERVLHHWQNGRCPFTDLLSPKQAETRPLGSVFYHREPLSGITTNTLAHARVSAFALNLNMKLTLAHYIAAAAVVIAITMTAAWLWSEQQISRLERDVRSAKTIAAEKESAAGELERRATEYKAKTEYLEQKVAEIQVIAQKQDEELKAISNNVDAARGDVHRARRTRSAAATAEDLCAKLAELDHPCR